MLVGMLVLGACAHPAPPIGSISDKSYYHDPALLEQAWKLPVAATYKPGFESQINNAFCGPATAVNALRSLGITQTQTDVFDNTGLWYWRVRVLGMTLDEMAQLMKAHTHAGITVLRDLTRDEFRVELHKTNDLSYRYLINFNRRPLFGVDIGHHSPIGGYLETQDLVFVLDVLDKYQPFLVPADRLYEAMNMVDPETGKTRGLIRVRVMTQANLPVTATHPESRALMNPDRSVP